jgi:hypothetical protein
VAVADRGRETDSMPQPFPVREKDRVKAILLFFEEGSERDSERQPFSRREEDGPC